MQRKHISIHLIALMIISVAIMGGSGETTSLCSQNERVKVYSLSLSLSKPNFEGKQSYVTIDLRESSSKLMKAGKPILPVITRTLTFPLGTKLLDIDVSIETQECMIDKKIEPAPKPVALDGKTHYEEVEEDQDVYESADLYPPYQYTIKTGAGLKNGEHVLYLNIRCYTQYSPANNLLYVPYRIEIKVTYQLPKKALIDSNQYNLLVITDEEFVPYLQPLVDHKNSMGIKTKIVTTQYIYSHYNGRDKPEDIKLFIKDALEQWGVKYVLLAGGRKGQTSDWYIPERESNNNVDAESYASDLYYADIYGCDGSGNVFFDDWDSNNNGVFAEWSYNESRRDIIDYYPDVYVGRLPFRNKEEVKIVVNKIINYERRDGDLSWFKRMIIIGGDTFPTNSSYYEGEIVTNLSATYLRQAGYSIEKLWTSLGTFKGPGDIIGGFEKGAGFVHMDGHGNPFFWGTHPPHEEKWVVGLRNYHMFLLGNRGKLPVVVVGGCHNNQFDVTLWNFLKGILQLGLRYFHIPTENDPFVGPFWTMEWVPRCWSWRMITIPWGGSIAVVGDTGLGYNYPSEYVLNGLEGWLAPRFFYHVGTDHLSHLGEIHGESINDYINNFDVNSDPLDRKTIEEWMLMGDPSLRIFIDSYSG